MGKQEKTLFVVAVADFFSTAIKFFAGYSMHSMALSAEAWHSLGDFGTTLIVLIAIILDRKEKNKAQEPSSDSAGKKAIIRRSGWELRASLVIGLLLMIISFRVLQTSISGRINVPLTHPLILFAVTCVLMLISYIRFNFEKTVGEETGSPALIADAYHSRVDMYALGLILATLVGEFLGIPLDRWAALVIGFLIMGIAFKILYSSTRNILSQSKGTQPEFRTVEDNLVIIFLGGVSQRKRTFQHFLFKHMGLNEVERRRSWLRKSIITLFIILLIVYMLSGFYIVSPREKAIVELFGVPINLARPAEPGLHYIIPWPFGNVRKVDVKTIRRLKIGYVDRERDVKNFILWTNVHYEKEYAVLTGDNTFLDIAAHVHFRISDPAAFLFRSSKPESILESVVYRSLLEIMETEPFFLLITVNREKVEHLIVESSQAILDRLDIGIEILQIYLKDMHPPMDVAPAFEDVVSAQEDKESFIEEAIGYEKSLIPEAKAESLRRIAEAEAERSKAVLLAIGKANAFKTLQYAFQKYAAVNKLRWYLEALESGLSNAEKYVVDPGLTQGPIDLYFNISRKDLVSLPETSSTESGEQK